MTESTEFGYPTKIDFFGTTLFRLCNFTVNDLGDYLRYDQYAENNLAASNKEVSDALTLELHENDKIYHEDIIDSCVHEFNNYQNIFTTIHRKRC